MLKALIFQKVKSKTSDKQSAQNQKHTLEVKPDFRNYIKFQKQRAFNDSTPTLVYKRD